MLATTEMKTNATVVRERGRESLSKEKEVTTRRTRESSSRSLYSVRRVRRVNGSDNFRRGTSGSFCQHSGCDDDSSIGSDDPSYIYEGDDNDDDDDENNFRLQARPGAVYVRVPVTQLCHSSRSHDAEEPVEATSDDISESHYVSQIRNDSQVDGSRRDHVDCSAESLITRQRGVASGDGVDHDGDRDELVPTVALDAEVVDSSPSMDQALEDALHDYIRSSVIAVVATPTGRQSTRSTSTAQTADMTVEPAGFGVGSDFNEAKLWSPCSRKRDRKKTPNEKYQALSFACLVAIVIFAAIAVAGYCCRLQSRCQEGTRHLKEMLLSVGGKERRNTLTESPSQSPSLSPTFSSRYLCFREVILSNRITPMEVLDNSSTPQNWALRFIAYDDERFLLCPEGKDNSTSEARNVTFVSIAMSADRTIPRIIQRYIIATLFRATSFVEVRHKIKAIAEAKERYRNEQESWRGPDSRRNLSRGGKPPVKNHLPGRKEASGKNSDRRDDHAKGKPKPVGAGDENRKTSLRSELEERRKDNISSVDQDRPAREKIMANFTYTSAHECSSVVITCDRNRTVQSVNLRRLNLTGTVPDEIQFLYALKELYLNENFLTGTIPTSLPRDLEHLGMAENSLTGTIPNTLSQLSGLRGLDLQGNSLSGTIPSWLGDLRNLTTLRLNDNFLNGTVPSSIEGMRFLRVFAVGENSLTGTVPSKLFRLRWLETIDLHANHFHGPISDWVGDGRLPLLRHLHIHYNHFSGTIPTQIGHMSSLRSFLMLENDMTGTIPKEMNKLNNLEDLLMGVNNLNGTIPFVVGEESFRNLGSLWLFRTAVTGTIPESIYSFRSLTSLILSSNRLSGTISTAIGNLRDMERLDLSLNNLSGTLPSEMKELSNLIILDVSYNHLQGSLPTQFGTTYPRMAALSISDNNFVGTVPTTIGSMTNLQMLLLNDNVGLSGVVPSTIREIGCLELLAVHSTSLSKAQELCDSENHIIHFHADCPSEPCTCCSACCDESRRCYENSMPGLGGEIDFDLQGYFLDWSISVALESARDGFGCGHTIADAFDCICQSTDSVMLERRYARLSNAPNGAKRAEAMLARAEAKYFCPFECQAKG